MNRSMQRISLVAGLALLTSLPAVAGRTDGRRVKLDAEQRMACQRAVDEVYWKHREWPAANPTPKPALSTILTDEKLRAKVRRTILESNALERRWGRTLTGERLQAEVQRLFRDSKRPEVLRELSAALGHDSLLVAECLARPLLADRLVRSLYASDQRIHGELASRAREELRDLARPEHLSLLGDSYREESWIHGEESGALTSEQWESRRERLVGIFDVEKTELPLWQVSGLQEDDSRFFAVVVLEAGPGELRLGISEWTKQPLGQWLEQTGDELGPELVTPAYSYPELPGTPFATGAGAGSGAVESWTPTQALPDGLQYLTLVWSGSEMLVWGGYTLGKWNSGARYDPVTDSWMTMSNDGAPSARQDHVAVWTGTEMIVWGGCGQSQNYCEVASGARYDPLTDSWTPTTGVGVPLPRRWHTGVWTGTEMVVFGGCRTGSHGNNHCELELTDGGRYNPSTDSWTLVSTVGEPGKRLFHTAVWTGSEMIVWGGLTGSGLTNTGGRYNPATDTWSPTFTDSAIFPRGNHTAVWTGSEMIVWSGGTGDRYDPAADSWTPVTTTGAPEVTGGHSAVWSGTEMIVWGGVDADIQPLDTGARYDPLTDSWTPTGIVGAPQKRAAHRAVWTGTEMIVWGIFPRGARYDPVADSWVPTNDNEPGEKRVDHVAVWTGAEMIVWGGDIMGGSMDFEGTGDRYDPATDSWWPVSVAGAPARREHGSTAVWTGTEMLVFGGQTATGLYGVGAKYNPTTDTWTSMSSSGAPEVRSYSATVWTGTEMLVWGGKHYWDVATGFETSTGGRYDPVADSWTATSMDGVPQARANHAGVWTGSELIVWGGYGDFTSLNSGGRYDLATDSWTPIMAVGAPAARVGPTGVWTGSEMLVWGGASGGASSQVDTGGRFNAASGFWMPITTNGAPSPRSLHTGIWTGSEMIIWGGCSGASAACTDEVNTGGRYDPASDSWIATTLQSAPRARKQHSTVWTGEEMIVWGGTSGAFTATGGRYRPPTAEAVLPTEVSPAGSENPLRFLDPTSLVWESGTENGAVTFNLYRGSIVDVGQGDNGSCYQADLPSNATTVGEEAPTGGSGWYYIVTGENAAGEGPMGADSDGVQRLTDPYCP